jgi:biopolymer transport protein ExbD
MQKQSLHPAHRSSTADDSLIPLINIVFLLLIFFMVAGQIATHQDPNIHPPESSSQLTLEPAKIELAMNSAGELLLDGQAADTKTLKRRVSALVTDGANLRVSLRADRNATAADLDIVLNQLRALGVSTITLHTLYTGAE